MMQSSLQLGARWHQQNAARHAVSGNLPRRPAEHENNRGGHLDLISSNILCVYFDLSFQPRMSFSRTRGGVGFGKLSGLR
jgi:hypothetical protein